MIKYFLFFLGYYHLSYKIQKFNVSKQLWCSTKTHKLDLLMRKALDSLVNRCESLADSVWRVGPGVLF